MLYGQTRRDRKWNIQDSGLKTSITFISACTHDSNEMPTAIRIISGSDYQIWILVMLYGETGRTRTYKIQDCGHHIEITYVSACIQDRIAISTAKPLFSGFNTTTELLRIFSNLTGSENPTW